MNSAKQLLKAYVPPELLQQVDSTANSCGMTRSQWICTCLDSYLNNKRFPRQSQHFPIYKAAVQFQRRQVAITGHLQYLKNQARLGRIEGANLELLNEVCNLSMEASRAILRQILSSNAEDNTIEES
ncbi:MAG: hypothetical protein SFY66_03620 [Oculatellaceae cyanobacterium bins.114]|nr:hypothetical protein [Oculatellaceae cyanobacterium bins.114]